MLNQWLRIAVLGAALPCLAMVGCGDDDDSNGGPNPTATPSADTPTPGGNTPAPTATAGDGETPVPTATPGDSGVSDEVQAFVGSVVGGLAGLSDIAMPSAGGAAPVFPITAPCVNGGTVTINCGAGGPGIIYELGFSNCDNPGSVIDADMTLETSGSCLSNPFPTGTVISLAFVGDLATEDPDTGNSFAGTVDSLSTFTVFANGDVEFATSGSVSSDCIGGSATFDTTETLFIPANGACPTMGAIEMTIDGSSHSVAYAADGVTIDGETFNSCEDLATCS